MKKTKKNNAEGKKKDNNKKNNDFLKKYGLIIACVVVVVIVVAILFIWLKNNSYENQIEKFCQGMNELDYAKIEETIPDEIDNEDGFEYLEYYFNSIKDSIDNDGAEWSATCKIRKKEKLDSERLRYLNSDFKDFYDGREEIKDGYNVTVNMTTKFKQDKNSDTKTEHETKTFIVGKINSKWYVINME